MSPIQTGDFAVTSTDLDINRGQHVNIDGSGVDISLAYQGVMGRMMDINLKCSSRGVYVSSITMQSIFLAGSASMYGTECDRYAREPPQKRF